jgi:hypothetical protein
MDGKRVRLEVEAINMVGEERSVKRERKDVAENGQYVSKELARYARARSLAM